MNNKPVFENSRDKSDFFIALAVIGFFLWLFLFSGLLGNKKKSVSEVLTAQVEDRDGDGVADNIDQCPEEFARTTTGCPEKTAISVDSDGDGVTDENDKCPNLVGNTIDGCPEEINELDLDGDGVVNELDKCPNVAGPAINDGCPVEGDSINITKETITVLPTPAEEVEVDTDNDGIADKDDECPNEMGGVVTNGCPDADKDGVRDKDDECPNEKGVKENNGCPKLVLEEDEQAVIDEAINNVEFEYGSAQLTNSSEKILSKVVALMEKYPNSRLKISGHTDNDSSSDFNYKLSENRANSAKRYIVGKGISGDRITAKGYGETQPIASNETEEGRKKNRRVEFVLQ